MSHIPIERAVVYQGRIRTDLRFSYGDVSYFPFTVIELHSGGHIGIGEGLVNDWELFERSVSDIVGRNPISLDGILPEYLSDKQHNIAREALSIAIWSLASSMHELPLHALLGRRKRDCVPLMPCIFAETPDDASRTAGRFISQCFRHLKVKFFGDEKKDLEILKAIRKAVGDEVYLQADANCGYKNVEKFPETLEKFSLLKLNVIEDPIDGRLEDYHRLRGRTDVRIMVDVSARSPSDVADVLKIGAADLINQHPCQQGGLGRALEISRAAEAAGVPTAVGGTGFLGIGTAAHQILASVIGLEFPCGELGGYVDHKFESSIVKDPLPITDGRVYPPESPGLGVELDRDKLLKLTDKVAEFR